eukprot:EG_transcript_32056
MDAGQDTGAGQDADTGQDADNGQDAALDTMQTLDTMRHDALWEWNTFDPPPGGRDLGRVLQHTSSQKCQGPENGGSQGGNGWVGRHQGPKPTPPPDPGGTSAL